MTSSRFAIRRRGDIASARHVEPGSVLDLHEREEYFLEFPNPLSATERLRLEEVGGELLSDRVALLSFSNFVGRANLFDVAVNVRTTKLAAADVASMLQEITRVGSSLAFGGIAPLEFPRAGSTSSTGAIPYHQLQILRTCTLESPVGTRLTDWLDTVSRNPTRRLETDRPTVPIGSISRLDHRAIRMAFSRFDRLASVDPATSMAASPLAHALRFGEPPRDHLPVKLCVPRGRLSFDTPENRFVKHVLLECLAVAQRFSSERRIHASVRSDCLRIASSLESALSAPHLAEAGRLNGFTSPSQALLKSDGYRDLLLFWDEWTRPVTLPFNAKDVKKMLQGRDIATLYEYWTYATILDCVAKEFPSARIPRRVEVVRSELGESARPGFSVQFTPEVKLTFNRAFSRSRGDSYSAHFRPDVVLDVNGDLFVFDAKYRLSRLDAFQSEETDNGPHRLGSTYKADDLHKMHAYRDALHRVRAAVAVYPGSQFAFFERDGELRSAPTCIETLDGVGAIPLQPDCEQTKVSLRQFVSAALFGVARSTALSA